MKTFIDFLKSKHADQYHGIDDDRPDDFQKWFYDIKIYNIVGYADEYAAIQKQEIVEKIEKENQRVIGIISRLRVVKSRFVPKDVVIVNEELDFNQPLTP